MGGKTTVTDSTNDQFPTGMAGHLTLYGQKLRLKAMVRRNNKRKASHPWKQQPKTPHQNDQSIADLVLRYTQQIAEELGWKPITNLNQV